MTKPATFKFRQKKVADFLKRVVWKLRNADSKGNPKWKTFLNESIRTLKPNRMCSQVLASSEHAKQSYWHFIETVIEASKIGFAFTTTASLCCNDYCFDQREKILLSEKTFRWCLSISIMFLRKDIKSLMRCSETVNLIFKNWWLFLPIMMRSWLICFSENFTMPNHQRIF